MECNFAVFPAPKHDPINLFYLFLQFQRTLVCCKDRLHGLFMKTVALQRTNALDGGSTGAT